VAYLFKLRNSTLIHAPIERCFLLSTHLAIVQDELRMRPVRGRLEGFVTNGDTVRWKGWKFGLPQYHESLIEAFEPPRFFRDRMIAGRFRSFEHDHALAAITENSTRLSDEVRFTMPLGRIGELAGACLLAPYVNRLMRRRFAHIRRIAESDLWLRYLVREE